MSLFTYLVVISLTLCTTVSQTNVNGKFPAHDLQLAGWLALPTTRPTLYKTFTHTLFPNSSTTPGQALFVLS